MKIVADENIPHLHTFFKQFGEIRSLPGRQMAAADVQDADILIVRSVTQVNETLLQGSNVRFVGTCTIGIDHMDTGYLQRRGIAYASAPGCNAGGVVQYVLAALAMCQPGWQQRRIGIVGHGNVGGRICRTLAQMGVDCVSYDPFLDQHGTPRLVSWESLLQSDIISMHTPLTRSGSNPTHHMMDADALRQLRPGALLLNAGRGGAIDNEALLTHLQNGADLQVVLDVWENEPHINLALAQRVKLGTPHIAGYSYEGKLNGTAMIHDALQRYLGNSDAAARAASAVILQQLEGPQKHIAAQTVDEAVLSTYDIGADHQQFMEALGQAGPGHAGIAFDHFRKNYFERREFGHYRLRASGPNERMQLQALGFTPGEL